MWKKGDKPVLCKVVPMDETLEDELTLRREVLSRTDWNVYQNAFCLGSIGKVLKTEDRHSGKRIPMPSSSTTLCQPTLLKKWQISKTTKFWINGFVIATIATKVTRQSVWQVRRESTGKHVADKVTTRPKVGVRCQGLPRKEPQQHEENNRKQNIGWFVNAIMSHPNDRYIHWLLNCKVTPRMPFSEDPNQIIHTQGKFRRLWFVPNLS